MEKRIKKMLVGMLVMSMLVGGVLSAQANTTDAEETGNHKVVISRCVTASPPLSEIQYQKFIAYLTGEYAPELKAEWDKAFTDRKAIEIPVQSNLPSNVKIISSSKTGDLKFGTIAVTLDKSGSTTPDSDTKACIVTDVEVLAATEAKGEAKNLTVSLPENSDKVFEGGVISLTLPQEDNQTFTEQFKLQDELDNAIQSNDGKAINTVLGKMLTNYKQISEDMKSSLSKVEITKTDK